MNALKRLSIVTTKPTKNAIIRRMGAIGRNLGVKSGKGYARKYGINPRLARLAAQLEAVKNVF